MEYGAELAEHASKELRDWASEYVEDHLRWHAPDLASTIDAVEAVVPARGDGTRDAVTYLVVYLAYEDQRELEESFTRDLEMYTREVEHIVEDLEMWERYGVPPSGMVTLPGSNGLAGQEAARMVRRLRELKTKSRMRSNQLRRIHLRVDFYLRVMRAAHEQMALIAPQKLAALQPQPPE